MSVDWEEMDRLDAFGTFGGRIVPYKGSWKIMLNETNCELWSFKTNAEAVEKLADAIKKSGYSDDENPLVELARLKASPSGPSGGTYDLKDLETHCTLAASKMYEACLPVTPDDAVIVKMIGAWFEDERAVCDDEDFIRRMRRAYKALRDATGGST